MNNDFIDTKTELARTITAVKVVNGILSVACDNGEHEHFSDGAGKEECYEWMVGLKFGTVCRIWTDERYPRAPVI